MILDNVLRARYSKINKQYNGNTGNIRAQTYLSVIQDFSSRQPVRVHIFYIVYVPEHGLLACKRPCLDVENASFETSIHRVLAIKSAILVKFMMQQ